MIPEPSMATFLIERFIRNDICFNSLMRLTHIGFQRIIVFESQEVNINKI
jgi:hypothetical protein